MLNERTHLATSYDKDDVMRMVKWLIWEHKIEGLQGIITPADTLSLTNKPVVKLDEKDPKNVFLQPIESSYLPVYIDTGMEQEEINLDLMLLDNEEERKKT